MPNQDLPEFLIIGIMKCGTSSLHYYLDQHPEIEMSVDKDLCYFSNDDKFSKGIEWYKSLFSSTDKMKGETSATYVDFRNSPETPVRIKQALGSDIKLILIARDPIERFISHYKHDLSAGRINEELNNFILGHKFNKGFIDLGSYNAQLAHYLKYFSRGQILILSSEKLLSDRNATLKKMFEFLGVDPEFYSPNFEELKHLSEKKKKLNKLGQFLRTKRFIWRYVHLLPFTGSKINTHGLDVKSHKLLQNLFKEDIEQFKKVMNYNFPEWETYNAKL